MFFGININEVFLFKEGEDCAFMEQKNIKLKKKGTYDSHIGKVL